MLSNKACEQEDTCCFCIDLFWDANRHCTLGHTLHSKHMQCHPKDISSRVQQCSAELKARLGEISKGRASVSVGRNCLHSVHSITASLAQVRCTFKVFNGENECHYFGKQAGPQGLLGWLEKHKQDVSYCVWQVHPPEANLPAMERNTNLMFNKETANRMTTVTNPMEMCRDVLMEHHREIENLQLR